MSKGKVIQYVCLLATLLLFGAMIVRFETNTNKYENMVDAAVVLSVGGSGVFIDNNVILTAAHVLEGEVVCEIELSDGTILESSDFYIDEKEDIGFIFVKTDKPHIAKVSPISGKLGDTVFLVGTPHNKFFKFTLTKGILSHLDRDIPEMDWEDLLQTDAEGGYGSSGGPLYDENGNVIGIYVGHAYSGGVGVSLCESAQSILEAYERCKLERIE